MNELSFILNWVERIVALAVFLALIDLLLPEGRVRAAVRVTGGLILLAVLLEPVWLLGTGGGNELLARLEVAPATMPATTAAPATMPSLATLIQQGEAIRRAGWRPVLEKARAELNERLEQEAALLLGSPVRVETSWDEQGRVERVEVFVSRSTFETAAEAAERAPREVVRQHLAALAGVTSQQVMLYQPGDPVGFPEGAAEGGGQGG